LSQACGDGRLTLFASTIVDGVESDYEPIRTFLLQCRHKLFTASAANAPSLILRELNLRIPHITNSLSARLGVNDKISRLPIGIDHATNLRMFLYVRPNGGSGRPHHHDDRWVIYSTLRGNTTMRRWRRKHSAQMNLSSDTGSYPAQDTLLPLRKYRLGPGTADLFRIGDLHSIAYTSNSAFTRLTIIDR
jgi:hypothetical protein